jgi:hypothetical protein
VRFAADERAETTLRLLAECLDELGGVPKVVLSDRMACLKGAVVANVVVPTAEYVLSSPRTTASAQGLRGPPLAVPKRELLRPDRDVLATRYELLRRAA